MDSMICTNFESSRTWIYNGDFAYNMWRIVFYNDFNYSYFYSGWKSRDAVPKLVEKYLVGEIKIDEFITHQMEFSYINDSLKLLRSGKRLIFEKEIHL